MHRRIALIRRTDRVRVAWKNGAGVTEEIAVSGATPEWRVSIAELGSEPSSFSTFSGKDRVFTVIGAHGVQLAWPGGSTVVEPLAPFAFDGSIAPSCTPAGPTRALNVMVDRTAGRASVSPRSLDHSGVRLERHTVTVVYVARGEVAFGNSTAGAGDCIVAEDTGLECRGEADVLVCALDLFASAR